jgi:hypothetical protein
MARSVPVYPVLDDLQPLVLTLLPPRMRHVQFAIRRSPKVTTPSVTSYDTLDLDPIAASTVTSCLAEAINSRITIPIALCERTSLYLRLSDKADIRVHATHVLRLKVAAIGGTLAEDTDLKKSIASIQHCSSVKISQERKACNPGMEIATHQTRALSSSS